MPRIEWPANSSAAGVGDLDDVGSGRGLGPPCGRSPSCVAQSPAGPSEQAHPAAELATGPAGSAACPSASSSSSRDLEAGAASSESADGTLDEGESEGKASDADRDDAVGVNPVVLAYAKHVLGRLPCACTCCGLLAVLAITAAGIVLMPPSVETDFGAFMKTDVNTSIMRDAFLYSLGERHKDDKKQEGRRLAGRLYQNFDLTLAYGVPANSESSFFDRDVLAHVVRFESFLRSSPRWQEMCLRAPVNEQALCQTGLSLANYALPSLTRSFGQVVPESLIFDGEGVDSVPHETTMRLLQQHDLAPFVLPNGFDMQADSMRYVRTVYRFKRLWCCTTNSMAEVRAASSANRAEWSDFVQEEVIPTLQAAAKGRVDGEGWPLTLYFDGDSISSSEVMDTLQGDLRLACGSVAFVFAYLVFHTRSFLLGGLGLLLITVSVPLAYVAFAAITGSRELHIASFLSVFLIVGLGSDVVFVYNDFWDESAQLGKSLNGRLAWTLQHAGKASLATSATTAVSFFANLASVLKPLRDFGFFMGLCVMLVWILLSTLFLPLCLLNERYCRCSCAARLRRAAVPPAAAASASAMAARVFGSGEGRIRSWTRHLYRWRRTCVFFTVVACALAMFCSIGSVRVDTGLPSIFPDKHNQNRGKEVLGMFTPLAEIFPPFHKPPPLSAEVCREDVFDEDDLDLCSLFWCEAIPRAPVGAPAPPPPAPGADDTCQCFRRPANHTCADFVQTVTVEQRWVDSLASQPDFIAAARFAFAGSNPGMSVRSQQQLGPIVLEEWETGAVNVMPMLRLEGKAPRPADGSCGWQEHCFCGTSHCLMPTTAKASTVPRPDAAVAADEEANATVATGRQLVQVAGQWTVPINKRATVDVIFGIEVLAGPQLLRQINWEDSWGFSESHDLTHHWAQRNMYTFCTGLPEDLKVTERRCWIEDFRNFVVNQGERFPIAFPELFDALLAKFMKVGVTGAASSKTFLYLRGGTAKASFFQFSIDLSRYASSDAALTHMHRWNAYLHAWNTGAHATARGAWHTSDLWVRAQAQNELISSTVMTLVIVLVLAFFGMLLFTKDATLAALVVMATIGVISGLIFFIVVVMGWAIGPIEVIALIVFIGYAVTYSLHIAHRYGSSDALAEDGADLVWLPDSMGAAPRARHGRVTFALRSIGGAALGSAATTVGCSVFLLFCTLTIFKKLGGVVLAVTLMSIAVALGPLPAALLAIGPRNPGGRGWPWLKAQLHRAVDAAVAGMAGQMTGPQQKYAVDPRHAAAAAAAAAMAAEEAAQDAPPSAAAASGPGGAAAPSPRGGAAAAAAAGETGSEPVDADFDISTIFWWARDVVGSVKDSAMDFGRAPAAGAAGRAPAAGGA